MALNVRAAVAHQPGAPLKIEQVQLRDPGPDDVLIEIKATGLCHTDLHVLEGHVPHFFPVILGHEGAGVVVECGKDVAGLAPGDHVIPFFLPHCGKCALCKSGRTNSCEQFMARMMQNLTPFTQNGETVGSFGGLGTFAQHTVVKADAVAKIRKDVPLDKACYIACGGATGLGAVFNTAKVRPGSSVAVFGLGGIGLNVVQGARMARAGTIVGIDTNPAKEAIARKLGATHFVNPKEVGDLPAHIAALTGGGADYCFECVGNTALMRQAFDCSHPAWGLSVIVGVASFGEEMSVPPGSLSVGRQLTGTLMGGVVGPTQLPKMVDWLVNGDIDFDDLITHRLPLERINEGFDLMKRGESIRSIVTFA